MREEGERWYSDHLPPDSNNHQAVCINKAKATVCQCILNHKEMLITFLFDHEELQEAYLKLKVYLT